MSSASSAEDLLYDLNGNLTNDGTRAYFWDTQNQLTAVEALDRTAGFQPASSATRIEYPWCSCFRHGLHSLAGMAWL